MGVFPYVLKLLQTTATDLRQILVFIWTKILALDKVSFLSINEVLMCVFVCYGRLDENTALRHILGPSDLSSTVRIECLLSGMPDRSVVPNLPFGNLCVDCRPFSFFSTYPSYPSQAELVL